MNIPEQEFHDILVYLADVEEVRFPHDHLPEVAPNADGMITPDRWSQYLWRGIEHEFSTDDPFASPKPTWDSIQHAKIRLPINLMGANLLSILRTSTSTAIRDAYGASSWRDEIHIRLRGGDTTDMDIERDRLRARYQAVKAQITAATDLAALQAIQSRIEDGTWADEPTDTEDPHDP